MADSTNPVVSDTSTAATTTPPQPKPESTPNQPLSDAATDIVVFPSHLPQPPFIHVEGIPNFRDLGGYACPAPPNSNPSKSYMIRTGLLFRCAHPTQLTPTGLKTLRDDLGIVDIYDLRSEPEIARLAKSSTYSPGFSPGSAPDKDTPKVQSNGTISIPGVTRHFTPVYQSEDYGPVALARKLKWYTAAPLSTDPKSGSVTGLSGYSEGFVNAYRDIAIHGAESYAAICRRIISSGSLPGDTKSGIAFHCTAGKDRTGVLAALLLTLCGVPGETIAWEYAITEPGLGSWRDLFIDRISRGGLGGGGGARGENPEIITREEAARICGSRAVNLRAWLEMVLEGEFGGVRKYFTEKCGLGEDEVDRLREVLVVEVPEKVKVVEPCGIQGWTIENGMEQDYAEKKEANGSL